MSHGNPLRLTSFAPRPKILSQAPKFLFSDTVDVFELPNSHRQKLTLDNNVEIRKQSASEKAEGTHPESEERAMTVLRLNEWLGLTEAGIRA